MTYSLLIALLAAFVFLGALAAGFVLVGVFRQDRGRALRWAAVLVAAVVFAGGTGLALAARAARSAQARIGTALRERRSRLDAEAREQQAREAAALERFRRKVEDLNRCVSPAVAAKIPPDFYTDDGFRDYWRRPLVYPYSMFNVDTFDQGGSLNRHKGGKISDPNSSEEQLLHSIGRYAFDCRFLLMRRFEAGEPSWELFEFEGGRSTKFPTEAALFTEARRRGYSGDGQLGTIRERFDDYFGR